MSWGLLLAPVLGAAIGYGTNWLAIKMLFWPQKPVFLFKKRLPMTPGLFVSRRHQFACQLAQSVEDGFVSGAEMRQALVQALDSGLADKVINQLGPFADLVLNLVSSAKPGTVKRITDSAADSIRDAGIVRSVIEEKVASMDVDEVEEMVMNVVERELGVITLLGGVLGLVVGSIQPLVWLLA